MGCSRSSRCLRIWMYYRKLNRRMETVNNKKSERVRIGLWTLIYPNSILIQLITCGSGLLAGCLWVIFWRVFCIAPAENPKTSRRSSMHLRRRRTSRTRSRKKSNRAPTTFTPIRPRESIRLRRRFF